MQNILPKDLYLGVYEIKEIKPEEVTNLELRNFLGLESEFS